MHVVPPSPIRRDWGNLGAVWGIVLVKTRATLHKLLMTLILGLVALGDET